MTFHIAELTGEQVAGGMLSAIGDAIDAAFSESSKDILQNGRRGGERENMLILFENSATNDSFYEQNDENIHELLYINSAAKSVLDETNLEITYRGTTNNPLDSCGTMIHLPRYVNFKN